MKQMLGALAGQNWKVTVKENLSADGMKSAIADAFRGADEDDICLFYYSGHGYSDYSPDDTQGALAGVDGSELKGSQLAYALDQATPGKVIVLLDSCGSGGLIYSGRNASGSTDETVGQKASDFVDSMIGAFGYFNARYRKQQQGLVSNTGELIGDKFQVLAACAYRESSAELQDDYASFGVFTHALVVSVTGNYPGVSSSYDGAMFRADTNRDSRISLNEAYTSVCEVVAYWKSIVQEIDQATKKSGNGSFTLFFR